MVIIYRILLVGKLALAFEQSHESELNSNYNNGKLFRMAEMGFSATDSVTEIGPMSSASSFSGADSWWHAFDGIPFGVTRRSTRKLSKKRSHNVAEQGAEAQMHRSLVFGDYADPTFNCPVTTTCPNVCVAKASDCPSDATCASAHPNAQDHDFELCLDGTCADKTLGESCDSHLETPCSCKGMPVACAKQIDLWDMCHDRFQEIYDVNAGCLEEQARSLPPISRDDIGPVILIVPMIVITTLMFLWCAYNQRFAPVQGSSSELESEHEQEIWTQTGYKSTRVGRVLYALIILGHVAVQMLLFLIVLHYYVHAEDPVDKTGGLRAFVTWWMIGFVWSFLLKYPPSIHDLFLRRALPHHATYVAVKAPVKKIDILYEKRRITIVLETLQGKFCRLMNFLYSMDSDDDDAALQFKTTYCAVETDPRTATRYFYFRMRRYIYDDRVKKFVPGRFDVTKGTSIGNWLRGGLIKNGLSMVESTWRLGLVGPNILDMKKPSIVGSVVREFSKPFYLYQNFMVWTWVPLYYYYMAIVQTVVRFAGGVIVATFNYTSDADLYQLTVVNGTADVVRDGTVVTIDKTDVVPGDIVRLSPGGAYFDMAILRSNHLLVDESSLTGEIHPVKKVQLQPFESKDVYDQNTKKTSTVFAGTTILECGTDDVGIVTQTGSFTVKGQLLSDVLSYERHRFKFDTEVKLVLVMLFIEMIVLVTYVLNTVEAGHWVYSWFYAAYAAGTCLPPLLPTVFVVSVGISCKRLQAKRITCTDSTGILAAGKVKKAFFDKTGTLTEQGLRFVSAQRSDGLVKVNKRGGIELEPLLQLGISCCHTLTLNADGELVGTAVDRQAFSAVSCARLLSDDSVSLGGVTIKYLKRFEFDHHSTTQSVIVQQGDQKIVFVKGSPEAIGKLCKPSSLPADFLANARHSARNGIYQLAIARSVYTGTKPMSQLERSDIERNLIFTGCINFSNSMKRESPAVIAELRCGLIESAIITGDNVLTGIYIARKSSIIAPTKNVIVGIGIKDNAIEWVNAKDDTPVHDPILPIPKDTVLAMTGQVWNHLLQTNPRSAMALGKHTVVFGRCTPTDKVSIVSAFVQYGDITMMCGDGGNDCGALKAAHVGVALSDSEASVVAPFTSLDKTITSVTEILKEGRCALASSFASYKYMIMYGQVETFNQVANAYFNITFGEWCWVFMDGIWPITMAFSLPLSRAARKLSPKHPTASILGPHTVSSACGVLTINFLFLVIALALLFNQDWFQCRMWDGDNMADFYLGDNYEASVIFIVTGYQYISSAAAFNFGYTFRRCWFKNYVFMFFFVVWTSIQFAATLHVSELSCIFRINCDNDHVVRSITFAEPQPINNAFNTTVMPTSFRGMLVALMIANLILVCGWEYFVVNGARLKVFYASIRRKVGSAEEDCKGRRAATKDIKSIEDPVDFGAIESQTASRDIESDHSDSKHIEWDQMDPETA